MGHSVCDCLCVLYFSYKHHRRSTFAVLSRLWSTLSLAVLLQHPCWECKRGPNLLIIPSFEQLSPLALPTNGFCPFSVHRARQISSRSSSSFTILIQCLPISRPIHLAIHRARKREILHSWAKFHFQFHLTSMKLLRLS